MIEEVDLTKEMDMVAIELDTPLEEVDTMEVDMVIRQVDTPITIKEMDLAVENSGCNHQQGGWV